MATWLGGAALSLQATGIAQPGDTDRVSTSPLAWTAAALLLLAAAYFLIRLIEWDLMNEETPNQDDPLLR